MPNLSEQVAALEARCAEWEDSWKHSQRQSSELRVALAASESRVSGAAREALERAHYKLGILATIRVGSYTQAQDALRDFRDREYPAVPAEGERTPQKCADDAHEWKDAIAPIVAGADQSVCAKCGWFRYNVRPAPTPARKRKLVTIQGRECAYAPMNAFWVLGGEAAFTNPITFLQHYGLVASASEYAALLSLRDGGE